MSSEWSVTAVKSSGASSFTVLHGLSGTSPHGSELVDPFANANASFGPFTSLKK